ncbi:MAG: ABC transporter ATP-binding protein [Planctomycetota bacterium]|nr:ABC transporter ATP-binding protein [Planctomycetota bacterium]
MIETRDLTKRYGNLIAANRINLKLDEGDVFGFIGPNGSGKTTTMRMLATLLTPDFGEAYVDGHSIYTHPREIRRIVGFMPDFFGVYDDMKVIEYLEFFAAAYRIDGPARRKVCEDKLELVDMTFKRDAMVNQLSRGQTQRIGLARVLLHEPKVLLLDEPLKRLGELKKTVMVSSHILPELADVCNKVGMIEKGIMVANARVDEVMQQVRQAIVLHVRVGGEADTAAKLVEQHSDVAKVEVRTGGLLVVTLQKGVLDYSFLPTLLVGAGHKLTLFREEELNLETAFMELTRGLYQ